MRRISFYFVVSSGLYYSPARQPNSSQEPEVRSRSHKPVPPRYSARARISGKHLAIKITPNLQGCKQGGIIDPPASNRIWQQQPSSAVLARTYKGEANKTGSSGLSFFILTKIPLLLQAQDARAKRARARCLETSNDAGTEYYGEGLQGTTGE